VTGTIGALLGGVGGAMIYYPCVLITNNPAESSMFALGIFFVHSVLPSWNIQGTIEGFHDPKFKKWPQAFNASLVAGILLAIMAVLIAPIGGS